MINPITVSCVGGLGSGPFYVDEARSCRVVIDGQSRSGNCQYQPSTIASVPSSSGLGPSAAAKTCDAATSIRAAVKHGVSAAYGEQLNSRSTGGHLKTDIKRLIAILAVVVALGFWPGL